VNTRNHHHDEVIRPGYINARVGAG